MRRLHSDLDRLARGIAALRTVHNLMQRHADMSKLSEVADRIKAKKLAHEAKADEMAARLDAIDQREPEVFDMADNAIAQQDTDLSGMEADMRALSNLAPGPLPKSPPASPPDKPDPQAVKPEQVLLRQS